MRVTHHSFFQPCLPPHALHVGEGGCLAAAVAVVVKGLMGGAVHTGAVVLSVWHIKLYKGNHLCATPYY